MTLLSALQGAYDAEGKITSQSLTHFLLNNTKRYLGAAELADPDIAKAPEIFESSDGRSIIFSQRAPAAIPRWPVKITLPAQSVGQVVEILDGTFQIVQTLPATEAREVRVELRPGLYLARMPGLDKQALFEVAGLGEVDIVL